jgi:parvulin-like peptidyl-prolyl isomerase
MPAAFDDAMASLRPGEIGGPVLTQYGYHLLYRRKSPTEKDYLTQ